MGSWKKGTGDVPPTAVRTAAALAATLLLGACGGSGGDSGGDGPTTAADAALADTSIERADGQDPDTNADAGASDDDPTPGTVPGDGTSAGGYVTAPGIEACSVDDVKARVDFDMRDYYVFASQVPDVSPAAFDTPDALIRGLRVAPDIFSSVSDVEVFEAQAEGRNVGYGFLLAYDETGAPRFQLVYGGSPSADAGLERGDVLLALDGEPVEALGEEGAIALLNGAAEGEAVRFTVGRDGARLDIDVARAEFVIDTIAGTFAFTADDGTRVGYVPILEFSTTTADALDGAFAFLVEQGVEALVLDVRYNRGGLILAANRLAAHVAGDAVAGGTFVKYLFNETYARELNEDVPFEAVDATLGLDRVVVVATGASASSAELLINGLEPYVDVEVVGSTTFGKAFGSVGLPYCDSVISAMLFITANAEEVTVAGGIEPDCAVQDTWDHPIGDPDDALTGAAVELLIDGTCPSDALAGASPASRARTDAAAPPIWDDAPGAPAMFELR